LNIGVGLGLELVEAALVVIEVASVI